MFCVRPDLGAQDSRDTCFLSLLLPQSGFSSPLVWLLLGALYSQPVGKREHFFCRTFPAEALRSLGMDRLRWQSPHHLYEWTCALHVLRHLRFNLMYLGHL